MARWMWFPVSAGLCVVSGCEQHSADRPPARVTTEDVSHDVGHAVNTAAAYSQQTREEFDQKLNDRLKDLDLQIAALRKRGGELQGEAKSNWIQKMAALEKKHDVARAKLAELRESSAEAWKDIQKGAQSAWDDLDKAFHDVSHEF